MIDLLEGIPGSGKSYEAVVYHVLPALQKGRKVITNLPLNVQAFSVLDPSFANLLEIRKKPLPILGKWEAEAADRGESCFGLGNFRFKSPFGTDVFPDQSEFMQYLGKPALPAPPYLRPFGHVWCFFDEWRGEGNIGPLYVIDECHNAFPRSNPIKRRGTSEEVIQWFKLHRHFGADVILMTQRMAALEEEIAGLAQFHIRVHKAHFLGNSNQYIRKVFAGYRGGEIQVNEREYKPQYFPLYSSHTQGSAVVEANARDVSSTFVKLQKFRRFYFFFMVAVVAWALWVNFGPNENKKQISLTAPIIDSESIPQALPQSNAPAPAPAPAPASAPVAPQEGQTASDEPLNGKTLHLTGWLNMPSKGIVYTLSVSSGGRVIFETDSHQLQKAGYAFHPVAECMAFVAWKGKDRAVVCDVPRLQQGSNERPIVVDTGAKKANQISPPSQDSIT